MQSIILVGKPNVGKSSLFNRLVRKRIAITSEISGTTRDITQAEFEIYDKKALLMDSGGLDEKNELFKNVKKNTLKMAENCDIILYLVDGKMPPDDEDKKFFYALKKLKKPMALLVNKIDNQKDEQRAWEFASFGVKEFFTISVTHNVGLDALYAWIYGFLKQDLRLDTEQSLEEFLEHFDENLEPKKIDENHIKVGIVGRVNVGKSSLLNALVKQERAVVSELAGTTIDPVNESIFYKNKNIEFIDTAGIRKRSKIEGLEFFALNRTEKILQKAQIALLVLDASEDFNELDERIAGLVLKHNLAVIIVLNKWDKAKRNFDETLKELRLDRFKFLAHAPIISVSALSKKRIHTLLDKITELFANFIQKLPTAKLNALIEEAVKSHPLPHDYGKAVKIYYAVQYDFAPPKIALVMNRPKALHFSYKRYLQNKLRENFDLSGVPLLLMARKKGQRDEE